MKLQKVSNSEINGIPSLSKNSGMTAQYVGHSNMQPKDSVEFTGKVPEKIVDPSSTEDVAEELEKIMPRSLNGMKKLKDNINEFQNILINSLGTGLIAPIFIKWNPLSKTDEDTRTYTAWRQPVSAALAIATQAVITLPFAAAIKSMASDGAFGQLYNETPYKDPEKFIRDLREKNTIYYDTAKFNGKKDLEEIKPETYDKLITHTFDDLINQENKEIKRIKDEKTPGRIARSKYYTKNSDKVVTTLSNLESGMKDIKTAKDAREYLNGEVKRMKKANADGELVKIVEELRDRALYNPKTKRSIWDKIFFRKPKIYVVADADETVMKSIHEKIDKIIGKDEIYDENLETHRKRGIVYRYAGKTDEEATQMAKESLVKTNNGLDEAVNFLTELKKRYKDEHLSVSDIEAEFRSKMGKNFRLGEKKFAFDVLKELKNYTKNNINIFKQVEGMTVSFAMLPITCELLNWLYPRFMDAVFPNLSSKKHAKVSSDLVNKATKNSEVK